MNLLKKIALFIYSLYAMTLFIVIMLLIFPFVLLAATLGPIKGGNLIFRLCTLWADLWFPLIFIFFKRIYEAPHDGSRKCMIVSNHISYLDAAIIVKVLRHPLRVLAKVEMGKVPVFGFIYRSATVAVDRRNPEKRARSIAVLKSIIGKGISVMVFPEGTFNKTHRPLKSFFDGAFRVAIETQIPVKPVLFLDAYSRMPYQSLFAMTPGRCRIVYMEEIPVAGLTLADVPALKQKVYDIMEKKLIEYKAAWIAEDVPKFQKVSAIR